MIIIPIEVFKKYLYNFWVWIECSTQVFYSYKPKSLNSIVVRTREHIGRGFLLDITLITTVHLHSKYEDSTKCSRCSEEQTVFIDGKVTAVTCVTIYARPSKIIARSRIKYTIVPSACIPRVLGHVWGHFRGVWGKQRRHGGEGERDMIDAFRRIWHYRLACGLVCPRFRSI